MVLGQMTSRSRVIVSHALARRAAGAIACVCSLAPEVSPQVFNLQFPAGIQSWPQGHGMGPTQSWCGGWKSHLSVVPVKCWLEKYNISNASVSFFGFRCDSGRCPW